MKGTLIVLCALFGASIGRFSPGLRVKFNYALLGFGEQYFYDMPKDLHEATELGWKEYDKPDIPFPQLRLFCYSNLIVCLFFDEIKAVAGLQIALSQKTFTGNPFDPTTQGFTEWSPGNGDTYWAIQQYYISKENLALNHAQRVQLRDTKKFLQEDAIWLTTFNKELLKVSADVNTMKNTGDFTLQACIPWMGTHYYYNMTKDTMCTADKMSTWFPLTDSGEVIGMGFVVFGKMDIDKDRDFFEHPGKTEVKMIVTKGPECLYDMTEKYGLATMHIYYIETPRQVGCSIFG